MSKIILTKKQAEFIEGFKERYYWSKEKEVDFADIHQISREMVVSAANSPAFIFT